MQLGIQRLGGSRNCKPARRPTQEDKRSRPGLGQPKLEPVARRVSLLLAFAALAACASSEAQEPSPSPTPRTLDVRGLIYQGDTVDVDFVGGFENDWRGRLASDGTLEGFNTFSETVPVLCRTESEVAGDIERVYAKYLRDPKVVVKIIDRSGRAVARLDGAVRTPTRFRLLRRARLRELIVAAGGLTDDASGDITVLRPAGLSCAGGGGDNSLQTLNIRIKDLLSGKESADPFIVSGDLISVNKAVPVYVIGAVNDPRPIFAREGITLSRAVASAGGLTKGAVEQNVTIFRRNGSESTVITADLAKIRSGDSADVVLQPFDIIEVAAKGGEARKYPPAIIPDDRRSSPGSEPPLKILE